jgi:hypothetical protein
MHRAKPSLKEGMQSWLDTLWAQNVEKFFVHIDSCLYINEKWYSRKFFPYCLV